MIIRPAAVSDIPVIIQLAHATWWHTYKNILSDEQIIFMLRDMYAEITLRQQMDTGTTFLIAEREGAPVAFAGGAVSSADTAVYKVQKFYIHPGQQGKGTGRKLMNELMVLAQNLGAHILELNVNRRNPAFGFYKHLGFEVYAEADIPYHQFWLNDYVMRKTL